MSNDTPTKEASEVRNGISRPKADTATGKVWEIADELSKQIEAPIGRKLLLDKAVEHGLNASTAATQYGRWRRFNGLVGSAT